MLYRVAVKVKRSQVKNHGIRMYIVLFMVNVCMKYDRPTIDSMEETCFQNLLTWNVL